MPEDLQKPQTGEPLQFDRAEYVEAAASGPTCAVCNRRIADHYYQLAGKLTCESCKERALQQVFGQSGAARFFKAFGFGTGAAIAGTIIYLAILKATNYHLALVTIVVGLMVGAAVRKGSNSRGGWLYQALAVVLTYCAIAATQDIVIIQELWTKPAATPKAGASNSKKNVRGDKSKGESVSHRADQAAPSRHDDFNSMTPGQHLWRLLQATSLFLAFLFITPILVASHDLIMLIIYLVGLWEAWKINRAPTLRISGPFPVGPLSAVR